MDSSRSCSATSRLRAQGINPALMNPLDAQQGFTQTPLIPRSCDPIATPVTNSSSVAVRAFIYVDAADVASLQGAQAFWEYPLGR
jgi:hypothetical protein